MRILFCIPLRPQVCYLQCLLLLSIWEYIWCLSTFSGASKQTGNRSNMIIFTLPLTLCRIFKVSNGGWIFVRIYLYSAGAEFSHLLTFVIFPYYLACCKITSSFPRQWLCDFLLFYWSINSFKPKNPTVRIATYLVLVTSCLGEERGIAKIRASGSCCLLAFLGPTPLDENRKCNHRLTKQHLITLC